MLGALGWGIVIVRNYSHNEYKLLEKPAQKTTMKGNKSVVGSEKKEKSMNS